MDTNNLTPEEVEKITEEFNQAVEGEPKETPKLAGKYKTVEELEKAYKSLESKLGQPKDTSETETPAKDNDFKSEEEVPELGSKSVTPPMTLEEYLSAVARGDMENETVRNSILEAHNLDPSTLQVLEEGSKVNYQRGLVEVYNEIGGKEVFEQLDEYVSSKYTPEEITALDRAIKDGPTGRYVLRGLVEEMNNAKQSEQVTSSGPQPTNLTNTSLQPFADDAELAEAMNDPVYLDPSHPKHKEAVETLHARYAISQGNLR